MGIAILFVLLFHLACRISLPLWLNILFGHLYIGVDIFMCASGFGLCYAYKKYDISQFYKRRVLRVYPCYLIMAICFVAMCIWKGYSLSVWDIFCYFSTLQYYQICSSWFDWYISALLLLYLLFPLFFKIRTPFLPSLLYIISVVYLELYPNEWFFEALWARIGIFVYGILMYRVLEEGVSSSRLLYNGGCLILIAVLLYVFRDKIRCIGFAISAGVTPLLMYLLYHLHRLTRNFSIVSTAYNVLCWLGKYTLSLYVADTVLYLTTKFFIPHISLMEYFPLLTAYSLPMVCAERFIVRKMMNSLTPVR